MEENLNPYETRVIGCLIEKEITTPEQYPLSLNALVHACNQKTNRDPVLNLDETTVRDTLDGLIKRHLVSDKTGFGSRVPKYQHRFCNTQFGPLQFTAQELGIICMLLLRGPQTPGELRTRTNRLCSFTDTSEVESTLNELALREDGPFVVKLPREPGKRESRYAHLFSGRVEVSGVVEDASDVVSTRDRAEDRVAELERQITALREEVEALKARLTELAP